MVLGLKENGKESGGGKEVQLITCAVTPIYSRPRQEKKVASSISNAQKRS